MEKIRDENVDGKRVVVIQYSEKEIQEMQKIKTHEAKE